MTVCSSESPHLAQPADLLGGWLLSILVSVRTYERKQEYQKRRSAEDAPNRMKSAPASQETARFLRAQVELLALQPFVGRQDYDKGKRDDEQEKQSTDKPSQTPVKPPRYES